MKISQLYIYPVKSLAGISLRYSKVTDRGLEYDRRWLLIDDSGKMLSQRTLPQLIHFKTEIVANKGIAVKLKGDDECLIPFEYQKGEMLKAIVWDDEFEVYEVSQEVSQWFSNKLGKQVKLVHQPDESIRLADPKYTITNRELVSAADGYPVLIASEASLEALNTKLENRVSMMRFRPNIVIKDSEAFQEDTLKEVSIGTAKLAGVKDCARCIMITNDLERGVLGKEPLRTLSSFRKIGKKVLFGRNFVVHKEGEIEIGEELKMDNSQK
ncbi:MOSC domain-containing protein [Jiulongibacter sp. NS-SX5]|uniref:MOSC domain-containing protein n=1 Tax=Jiulongibacter sp. NS-SX5 TaxID=3463854 RepID=UPI00405888CE